ncbi:hypothetical protein C9374_002206 [Naegleria lovaniensis]|uniref:Uncharacterized protein n=1 Tax=Naegleria lovaniensis TaxID=51637 RepID=A0AA88GSY7_NAELO|nr:uncharacterized protein C9374_002206 [Naegleria lovaniensis]KAG2386462.1 hypothetical protein C9374_002206 [Naegleria lovaniensis]
MGSYPSSFNQNGSGSFQHPRASAQYSVETNRSIPHKKPPPIKIPKNSRELDFRYIDPNDDPPIDEDKIRSFSPPPSRRYLSEESNNDATEDDQNHGQQMTTTSDQETSFKIGEDDDEFEAYKNIVNVESEDEDGSECLMGDSNVVQIFSIANPFLYLRSTSCRYSPAVGHLATNGSTTSSDSGSFSSIEGDSLSPTTNLTIFSSPILNSKQTSPISTKTKKRRSHSLMPLQPIARPISQESSLCEVLEQSSASTRARSRSVSDTPTINSPATLNTNTPFDQSSTQSPSETPSNRSSPRSKQTRNSVFQNTRTNSPPPTFSITISSPAEEVAGTKLKSKQEPVISSNLNEYKIGKSTSNKGEVQEYNLSEFKMGASSKKKGDDLLKLANSPVGPQKTQKKVNFMGPLVDILVHGGLGVPTNHKIRRHSYTPAPKLSSNDLLQDQPKTPSSPSKSPLSPTQSPLSPSSNKPSFLSPNSLLTPNPSQSKKRELRKSVADISHPEPVPIEPSPKLFVATISKTRRMSLKDENAERLNDLLLRQKLNQYKV